MKENTLNKEKIINFPVFSDFRGNLSVAEMEKHIPFNVKRVFIIYDVPDVNLRGEHAHKECHQLLVCVKGSIQVSADDGTVKNEYILNTPSKGLHLPPMIWGTQYNFSEGAVLMVLASEVYIAEDYIRDYKTFLSLIK